MLHNIPYTFHQINDQFSYVIKQHRRRQLIAKMMTIISNLTIASFLICCSNSGYAFTNTFPSPVHRTIHLSGIKLNCAAEPPDDVEAPPTSHRPAASRRQIMMQLAGALSATPIIAAANADPSVISSIQGPLQDIIAPGHWIGQFLPLNSKTENWNFASSSPADVSAALVEVLNELTPERRAKLIIPNFKISTKDANHVHVITWTKNEWLDSLDVKLKDSGGGCTATASFYATGFLPTSIPLAPIVNVGMAWFPFASPGPRGEMLQDFRLRAIHGLLDKKLHG